MRMQEWNNYLSLFKGEGTQIGAQGIQALQNMQAMASGANWGQIQRLRAMQNQMLQVSH